VPPGVDDRIPYASVDAFLACLHPGPDGLALNLFPGIFVARFCSLARECVVAATISPLQRIVLVHRVGACCEVPKKATRL
jgi:hypothetical protein